MIIIIIIITLKAASSSDISSITVMEQIVLMIGRLDSTSLNWDRTRRKDRQIYIFWGPKQRGSGSFVSLDGYIGRLASEPFVLLLLLLFGVIAQFNTLKPRDSRGSNLLGLT